MPVYGFYNNDIRQSFLDAIKIFNLNSSLDNRQEELVVRIEGDIDFDTELEIDEIYNRLLGDGLDLWADDEEATGLETNAAGVRVELSTGQVCQIRIDIKIMNKVLGCLTPVELENFVQQIAAAVENPSNTSLCDL